MRFERDLSLSPFSLPSFLPGWLGWLAEGEKEEEGLPVLRTKRNRCCDSDPPRIYKKRKCLHCNENACLGDGCTSPPRGWGGRKNQRLCMYTDADWNFLLPPLRCLLPSSRRRTFSGEIGGGGRKKNLKTSTRSTFVCREKKIGRENGADYHPREECSKKFFSRSS